MISETKKIFNNLYIEFTEQNIQYHESKKMKNTLYQTKFIELDSNEIILAIYPNLYQINSEQLSKQLGIKNYKFVKNINSSNISKIILNKYSNHENEIKIYDKKNLILNISTSSLQNNSKLKLLNFSLPKKYKASIRTITPITKKNQINNSSKCFLGFSLGNDNFKGKKLEAILNYIEQNFDECNIVLADSIYRNTIQINSNINEKLATQKALSIGIQIEKELINEISNRKTKFLITKCSSLVNNPSFQFHLEEFRELFSYNSSFKKSVLEFTEKFLKRNYVHSIEVQNLSINYILEELACAACLLEKGYNLHIYPGDLKIFTDISNENIEGVPALFSNLINIDLRIRS